MDESAVPFQEGTLWEMAGLARVITLIGAGGKTTTLLKLAEEMSACGQSVVMTTTTKVYPLLTYESWCNSKLPPPLRTVPASAPSAAKQTPIFWYAGVEKETGKWIGPAKALVDQGITAEYPAGQTGEPPLDFRPRCWVIEGDGAREKRLKCWGTHEPQIPGRTECSILLLDAGLWGHPLLPDDVHHPERCHGLADRRFTVEFFWEYLEHSPLWSEDSVPLSNWVILFNVRSEAPTEFFEILLQVFARWRLSPAVISAWPRQQKSPRQFVLRVALSNVLQGKVWWLDLS